jgi:hypothetical protein
MVGAPGGSGKTPAAGMACGEARCAETEQLGCHLAQQYERRVWCEVCCEGELRMCGEIAGIHFTSAVDGDLWSLGRVVFAAHRITTVQDYCMHSVQ